MIISFQFPKATVALTIQRIWSAWGLSVGKSPIFWAIWYLSVSFGTSPVDHTYIDMYPAYTLFVTAFNVLKTKDMNSVTVDKFNRFKTPRWRDFVNKILFFWITVLIDLNAYHVNFVIEIDRIYLMMVYSVLTIWFNVRDVLIPLKFWQNYTKIFRPLIFFAMTLTINSVSDAIANIFIHWTTLITINNIEHDNTFLGT